MALGIIGSNATFDAFVQFAETQHAAGKDKAIARFEKPDAAGLGGIANRTIIPGKGDWVGIGAGRLASLKKANNITRDAFMKAVSDMFGGMNRIPASVKEAMKLEDYGKGKPLTARRILAVKDAIEKSGFLEQMAEQKAFEASISKFKDQAGMETKALSMGYSKGELPKLAKAVNLYAQASGCSEAEALEQVSTPGSKANRLMNYGGRFLQSADNFKNGLRLMDSFKGWFAETYAKFESMKDGRSLKYEDGMSMTLLNTSATAFSEINLLATEKFVFEEFAVNDSIDLAETDTNKNFGIENNTAASCILRGFSSARTQTFAQIPPEKRSLFLKALTVMVPPSASNAAEAGVSHSKRNTLLTRQIGILTARVLKNFDQIANLQDSGKFTQANLVKTCFPEIPKPGEDPMAKLKALYGQWEDCTAEEPLKEPLHRYPPDLSTPIQDTMEATGCSTEDAYEMVMGRKQLPTLQYYSSGTLSLASFGGSLDEARNQLAGDLHRAEGYFYDTDGKQLLGDKDGVFRFNLPGGKCLVATKSGTVNDSGKAVVAGLEELCGKVHPRQTSSLLMMTSQSGLGPLRGALSAYGIKSTEHSAVDFTITKDDKTGDITVRYSSPKVLPFSFEWTATVSPDGYVTTTPLRFTDEATLKEEMSVTAAAIKDSAKGIAHDGSEKKALADKTAEMMVSLAKPDRDLMALLRMNNRKVALGLMLNGANHIRSEAKIAQGLENLRENINELRMAANGNKRIFDIGMTRLASFGGTALKSGMIAKMCELIAKEDLGWLRELNPSSSPEKICENICRLDNLMVKIRSESKVLLSFNEVFMDETSTANMMILGLIFAHCDEKTLGGIKDALCSENCLKMMNGLDKLDHGYFPQGKKIQPELRIAMSDYAGRFNMVALQEMRGTVNEVMGLPDNDDSLGFYSKHSISDSSFGKMVDIIESSVLKTRSLNTEKATNHTKYEP